MMEPSLLSPEATPQSAPHPMGNGGGGGALMADAETLSATDSQIEVASGKYSGGTSKAPSSPVPSPSACPSEIHKGSAPSVH